MAAQSRPERPSSSAASEGEPLSFLPIIFVFFTLSQNPAFQPL